MGKLAGKLSGSALPALRQRAANPSWVGVTPTGPAFPPSLELPTLMLVVRDVFDHSWTLEGDEPEQPAEWGWVPGPPGTVY